MFAELQAPFLWVDVLRFGISVTPSAQGNFAGFLVRESFMRFLGGDTTGRGQGGVLPTWSPGEKSSQCPQVAGKLRPSQQVFLPGEELSGDCGAPAGLQG